MKSALLIPTLAFAFLAVSCAGNSTEAEGDALVLVERENDNFHAEFSEVQLNNGKKWDANAETTQGVNKMLLMVKDEVIKDNPDYIALKDGLNNEFNVVLDKCTMKGESHDQLHNYLLPLKAKIDKLESTSNLEQIGDIDNYLLSYSNYFK